jgi:twinkle protein
MTLTPREISERLSQRAEAFAQWLLPNGKREGAEWCAGSIDGEAGKSLKVRISGDKAGVWADFAGNASGDLLDLIAAIRGVSIGESIKLAKDWLGIRDPQSIVPNKTYSKPPPKACVKPKPDSAVMNYLLNERQLAPGIIQQFKVAESKDRTEIAFPSFSPEGDLINIKYIALKRDENGKKNIRQEKGCAPSMFGWHTLDDKCREVIICEGQIDAMTWSQVGFPALSIPDGAKNDNWIDYDWDNLQRFDTIFLAYDNDDVGQEASLRVSKRLGLNRCRIVKFEKWKDANEALQAGATADDFGMAIANAKHITPEHIKTPKHYRNKVVEKFFPPDGTKPGFWTKLFHEKLGCRPGEVTIWTGISGHGKSVCLGQVMVEALISNYKVAIGSFEMLGEQTLHRMICQAEVSPQPSVEDIDRVIDWMCGRLWIYDILGTIKEHALLELMEYSVARHGVQHFVIDSLMKCDVGSDDYDAQRKFLNRLSAFAKEHGVHIHLVAHARKGQTENDAPGKLDVKGSSDIINQADNIITVWRNKAKEEKKFDGELSEADDKGTPDAIVYCHKQRETGVEFKYKLSFFSKIFRYTDMGVATLYDLSITRRVEWGERFEEQSDRDENTTHP